MTVYGKAVINVIMHTLAKTDGRCHPLEERPLTIREYAKFKHSTTPTSLLEGCPLNINKSGMLFRLNSQNVYGRVAAKRIEIIKK
jgi:hypothetical protein